MTDAMLTAMRERISELERENAKLRAALETYVLSYEAGHDVEREQASTLLQPKGNPT